MKQFSVYVGVLLSVLMLWGFIYAAGIRVNTTPSIPLGVYQLSNEPLVTGSYVLFCPPPAPVFAMAKARGYVGAGFCPGGYGQLMKRLVAAKNDRVTINAEGVVVNGQRLPLSKLIKLDGGSRPLPHYAKSWVLGSDEVLVMSDSNSGSFDGRYFGSIQRAQIVGVIHPVFTW
jgi:conjugative transfer signal peptidase TraF